MTNIKLTYKFFSFLSTSILCLLLTLSCNKSDRDNDNDLTMVDDYGITEALSNDVLFTLDKVVKNNSSLFKTTSALPTCAIVTIDSSVSPKKIIIDFGTTGCTDGEVIKKGKIIAYQYGKYRSSGSKITFALDNYYFNDQLVTGTATLTNTGKNPSNKYKFTYTISNASIKTSRGTIYWNTNRYLVWTEGDTTLSNDDDKFATTGTLSGNGISGVGYTATIDSIIELKPSCNYPGKGKVEVKAGSLSTRKLDFGDGTCDKTVTVTYNFKTETRTLN